MYQPTGMCLCVTEFQNLKNDRGEPVEYVLCNKGL